MTDLPLDVPRRASAGDPQRPQFHFTAPANWLNDPNGLIQWRGQYHLFYQHNPNGPVHGTIHWGHAVSDDLVHWRDLPIALAPTPDGPDAQGCWSGCAVDDDGVPTLVYTGDHPQVVNIAISSDGLLTWEKYGGNPVIAGPPAKLAAAAGGDFLDPFVWRAAGSWHMVIGTKSDGGGLVLGYRSDDLRHWEYVGPVLRGDANQTQPFATGAMWECPNLLDFGAQQALIISAQAAAGHLMYPFYATGVLRPDGFISERQEILVHGGPGAVFYAPQAMRRADGSYLLWGWLREGRDERACRQAGWAGALSLPLTVSLASDGRLCLAPAPELQALRGHHWHFEDITLLPEAEELLTDAHGDCLEIIAQLEFGAGAAVGLKLRCSPNDEEYTSILVQQATRQISIDRAHASLAAETERGPCVAPIAVAASDPMNVHIFLDRSVLEVFAEDGRTDLATRIYPTRPDSLGIRLFSDGAPARVRSLDVWQMETIW
jgi:beta-fructofuranosidase